MLLSTARSFWGRMRGLEPPTFGTTNRRSNRLSYNLRLKICAKIDFVFANRQRQTSGNFKKFVFKKMEPSEQGQEGSIMCPEIGQVEQRVCCF